MTGHIHIFPTYKCPKGDIKNVVSHGRSSSLGKSLPYVGKLPCCENSMQAIPPDHGEISKVGQTLDPSFGCSARSCNDAEIFVYPCCYVRSSLGWVGVGILLASWNSDTCSFFFMAISFDETNEQYISEILRLLVRTGFTDSLEKHSGLSRGEKSLRNIEKSKC